MAHSSATTVDPAIRIARLNTNGTLDATFNPGGAGTDGIVLAIAVQPDGKAIIGGAFTSYNGNAAASDYVMRLSGNGARDTSFNVGGAGADFNVNALAVQPGGKIVIGGGFSSYNGNGAASDRIARLNPNGTLDTTFNSGGAGADSAVYAVAVQTDGKVLLGGQFTSYNSDSAASDYVARLNANGTLDTSFNYGGAGADNEVNAVAVQPDGKVVIGGEFTSYNGNAAVGDFVARLLPATGAMSPLLCHLQRGRDGRQRGFAYARTGGTDNRAVAKVTLTNGTTTAADYRLQPGTLDTTFNYGGVGADSDVLAVALQPEGQALIGGYSPATTVTPPAITLPGSTRTARSTQPSIRAARGQAAPYMRLPCSRTARSLWSVISPATTVTLRPVIGLPGSTPTARSTPRLILAARG